MRGRREWTLLSCLIVASLVFMLLLGTAQAEGEDHWDGTDLAGHFSDGVLTLPEDFTGEIAIPADVETLTIDGQGYKLRNVYIEADNGMTLTIRDLQYTAPDGRCGLVLFNNSELRVEGDCSITAGDGEATTIKRQDSVKYDPSGIACLTPSHGDGFYDFTLEVAEGASLTVFGGNATEAGERGGDGIVNATRYVANDPDSPKKQGRIMVGKNATLSVYGGDVLSGAQAGLGINNNSPLILTNHGTVHAQSGKKDGAFNVSGILSSQITLEGEGVTTSMGDSALYAYEGVAVNGGTIDFTGYYGIWADTSDLTIAEGVKGRVIGGILGLYTGSGDPNDPAGNLENHSTTLQVLDAAGRIKILSPHQSLDLIKRDAFGVSVDSAVFLWEDGGRAFWTKAAEGDEHARNQLVLENVSIDEPDYEGISLSYDADTDLIFKGQNTIQGRMGISVSYRVSIDDSSMTIVDSADLTIRNGQDNSRLGICGNGLSDLIGMGISTAGEVTVAISAESQLLVSGESGEPNQNLGRHYRGAAFWRGMDTPVDMTEEEDLNRDRPFPVTIASASGEKITLKTGLREEAGYYTTKTYTSKSTYTFGNYTPPAEARANETILEPFTSFTASEYKRNNSSSGSSSTPTTYSVVYHANYSDGPKDEKDSGYASGDTVTVKKGSLFTAPSGKTFAGWAESASGKKVYDGGDTFKMPAQTVHLYALWSEGTGDVGGTPRLNREDHMAYLNGYSDQTIRPHANITREEVAAVFYRLLDEESRDRYRTTNHAFRDVPAGRWSTEAIATMANAGIIKGTDTSDFEPGRSITRAEFTAIAARFNADTYSGTDLFPDIKGHWAAEEINRAAHKGWIKGTENGNFEPNRPITRAEAASFINRVLERAPQTAGDLLPEMNTWTDNQDTSAWYYLDLQEAGNDHRYERKSDGVYETWTSLP